MGAVGTQTGGLTASFGTMSKPFHAGKAAMDELFPLPGAEEEKEEDGDSVESGLQRSRPANRPLGRPHGTLFLVDAKTRRVLWSTYLGYYERTPKKLNGEAKEVVARMATAMGGG